MLDFLKNGQGEILNLMFSNPDKRYYLAEIAKILGKEPANYQRYIEKMISDGIFCEERIGNMRFFWLNKNYQLYDEIKGIISKTIGVEAQLREIVNKIDTIEVAFIFGSFATDKFNSQSDIDLFIIGEVNNDNFIEEITKLETQISRDINYHIYRKQDVMDKLAAKHDFINNIFSNKMILLKGNTDEFRKFNPV
ncbi:MAG: nucleotidyltransferase domain-containing protein [Parcubacteria group bacterium]|nr:nucleotidyltransferase domain-containing protein [Parcubacteria group bacterium]